MFIFRCDDHDYASTKYNKKNVDLKNKLKSQTKFSDI
jgi:hypothetical protein